MPTSPSATSRLSSTGEPSTTNGEATRPRMVLKRDGTHQPYSPRRVRESIRPVLTSAGIPKAPSLNDVVSAIEAKMPARHDPITTSDLHDVIVSTLTELGQQDAARAYSTYRVAMDTRRQEATSVDHNVARLTSHADDVINENANKDARQFHTQRDLLAGSVSKARALAALPARVASAHIKGQIHYHDLDYSLVPMTNCCLPDFAGMLRDGFTLGNARVETPRSIATAATVLSQAIAAVASSQYGGVTVETIDLLLAPYAERTHTKNLTLAARWIDDPTKHEAFARERTTKDIYDAMQTLEYQIQSLMTTNGQTPFCSVGFGLGASWIEREIQKAILQVRIEGLGAEKRTAIFPKLIFTIKEGLNDRPGTPNYDIKQLAVQCSVRRMYPDVLSYENITELTGSFKSPMGCRSFLSTFTDEHGTPETVGRMNLGVVTLNLPRIALEARESVEEFWALLDERLDVCHEALRHREAYVRTAKPENAPILYMEGGFGKRLQHGEPVGQLFDNGRATLSLGYIGLYEVATVFFGPRWERDPQARAFTMSIIEHMKATTTRWNTTDMSGTGGLCPGAAISIYSTPSESLTDRFARLDLERFGPVDDVTVKRSGSYYTNSFHLDVRKAAADGWTPFDKLDFEVAYPRAGATGGFISYVEYPVLTANPAALEAVWDYAISAGIAYLGSNIPIDVCYAPGCGYSGDFIASDEGFTCPQCGNDDPDLCDVVKRTCGYLGQPSRRKFVQGRQAEVVSRQKHVTDACRS